MTFVLIDNSLGTGACCRLFEDPVRIVAADSADELGPALARLEQGVNEGLYAAGFFSYEAGYVLEPRLAPLLPKLRDLPLIWFGLFEQAESLGAVEAGAWLRARTPAGHQTSALQPLMSERAYLERFAKVHDKIAAGDIYQMNLTFKSRFYLSGSPLSLYLDLRARQKVAYGALIETDDFHVLSASPELFVRRHGHSIESRPMKGTAARGPGALADKAAKTQLARDAKQRAENLMIVDLMRNDLGRVSRIGSVAVSDLYAIETYPTLHQMTTTVRATLRRGLKLKELLKALFPPGSVTGAPKIRAMELIRAYEDDARGVYTGAIGMICPGGDCQFNVAIRTAVVAPDGLGEIGIGSGVVADSDGPAEYAECLLKSKFFCVAPEKFKLIETMLHDGTNGYWLLDRHMARLAASARHFQIAFDEHALRSGLAALVQGRPGARLRVRVLLDERGDIDISARDQPRAHASAPLRFALSPVRFNSNDQFLFHKTTRRQLYDQEFARSAREMAAGEVVFTNQRGELTEGSRSNIFLETDGRLATPALVCGLLPGTLRADLLESGRAAEAILKPADLGDADAIYLGNSVRGLQRAEPLVASP